MTTTPLSSDGANATAVHVVGGRPLNGRIHIQGSKNIALHLYAAAFLTDEPVLLTQVPGIIDTRTCARILEHAGADVAAERGRFAVAPAADPHRTRPVIDPELGSQVRTTVVLAAAVLARAGEVAFPYPGGDAFCPRLIDRHLAAMHAAGADVTTSTKGFHARCAPAGVRAFTVDVNTPYGPSLGATVTAMLLAARAPGTSFITHPSVEPEVTETARFLSERGVATAFAADGLHVTGSDTIRGGTFTIAPDRIEAATMIMAAAATRGNVHLANITAHDLPLGLTSPLADAGIALTAEPRGGIRTRMTTSLRAIEAATGPHPGLPTDTAPQLTAMLTQANGSSRISERVYPQRDTHVAGLRAFGADVTSTGSVIDVRGAVLLRGATVEAADIRAVTALLIAALAAEGPSTIHGMYHLRRGYGHLLENLATLGADITIAPGGP